MLLYTLSGSLVLYRDAVIGSLMLYIVSGSSISGSQVLHMHTTVTRGVYTVIIVLNSVIAVLFLERHGGMHRITTNIEHICRDK